ncbi:MAG: hypothetical protein ACTSUF_09745 [Candidatus Heimdallarchaeaceae archaeon]
MESGIEIKWWILAFFIVTALLDYAFTYNFMTSNSPGVEANPVVRQAMMEYGVFWGLTKHLLIEFATVLFFFFVLNCWVSYGFIALSGYGHWCGFLSIVSTINFAQGMSLNDFTPFIVNSIILAIPFLLAVLPTLLKKYPVRNMYLVELFRELLWTK